MTFSPQFSARLLAKCFLRNGQQEHTTARKLLLTIQAQSLFPPMSVASADAGQFLFAPLPAILFADDPIFSPDLALLSAARAYASLKMAQNPSSSSNSVPSTPSTPVPSSESRPHFLYSRGQLLALHNSPLCVRPPALKPLSEWFGYVL